MNSSFTERTKERLFVIAYKRMLIDNDDMLLQMIRHKDITVGLMGIYIGGMKGSNIINELAVKKMSDQKLFEFIRDIWFGTGNRVSIKE